MSARRLLVVTMVLAIAAESADAQIFQLQPPSREPLGWSFDLAGQFARPVGAFRANVDHAWGIGGTARHRFRRVSPLGLRADLSFLNYGSERQRVPLSPTVNRVLVDMTTANNIFVVSGGPEVVLTRGPIRPYAYVFAGYSYFFTESSAGDEDGGSFANTTNYDDGGLATGGGGGVRIPLRFRTVDAALDAGARLTRNGTRTYLKPGDIIDQPDGSLRFTPRTTLADFWQYHIGMSFSPTRR